MKDRLTSGAAAACVRFSTALQMCSHGSAGVHLWSAELLWDLTFRHVDLRVALWDMTSDSFPYISRLDVASLLSVTVLGQWVCPCTAAWKKFSHNISAIAYSLINHQENSSFLSCWEAMPWLLLCTYILKQTLSHWKWHSLNHGNVEGKKSMLQSKTDCCTPRCPHVISGLLSLSLFSPHISCPHMWSQGYIRFPDLHGKTNRSIKVNLCMCCHLSVTGHLRLT